jgi:hypothetical protein
LHDRLGDRRPAETAVPLSGDLRPGGGVGLVADIGRGASCRRRRPIAECGRGRSFELEAGDDDGGGDGDVEVDDAAAEPPLLDAKIVVSLF